MRSYAFLFSNVLTDAEVLLSQENVLSVLHVPLSESSGLLVSVVSFCHFTRLMVARRFMFVIPLENLPNRKTLQN